MLRRGLGSVSAFGYTYSMNSNENLMDAFYRAVATVNGPEAAESLRNTPSTPVEDDGIDWSAVEDGRYTEATGLPRPAGVYTRN